MGSLVFLCWKEQCQHLLPVPGGQRMCRRAPASGLSSIPRMLRAVEGESVGTVSEAQGPQRDTGAPARQPGLWQGTGSQAGATGLHSWPDPSAKIPTSPYRVQSAGNPAAGTAVRTHFAKVLKTAGGARSQGRGGGGGKKRRKTPRCGGDCGSVAQLLSPQATQMCSVGSPRMSVLAWEANLAFQGQGGGSQPPLKPP